MHKKIMFGGIKNLGIGTDIESIHRFKNLDNFENNSFLNKIFTKNELKYCFSKGEPAPHLAARFTGKEAIIKALTNISKLNLNFKDIEIINNKKGVPIARINKEVFHNIKLYLSLSHCKDKAVAFAIALEV